MTEMVVARSFVGFITGLLNALGRDVIPNIITGILSAEKGNDPSLSQ